MSDSNKALRVAIVGARRRAQGTGEFVARWFSTLGCRVEAIVGTSDSTVSEAKRALHDRYGLTCRGYLSLDALLSAETVDVVAICSPAECHRQHLQQALAAGCHVFCEKPLVWPADGAHAIVEGFAARGLALELNTQWPRTLAAFEGLHPGILAEAERFEMTLEPASCGAQMVVDSAPHFLSLLRAIAGPGTLSQTRVMITLPERMSLFTAYAGSRHHLEAFLHLKRNSSVPRRAGYAVNGRQVERLIEPPYRVFFQSGPDRRVEVEDPTALTIADFMKAVETGRRPDVAALGDLSTQLEELVAVAAEASVGSA